MTASTTGFTVALVDEAATARLAADIADVLEPGDFVALSGDLGTGKTTFVRALIAHLAGDAAIEVPSPTFTLVQHYDLPRFTLVHADLYRLTAAGELAELGLDDAPGAVVVMEWPERAGSTLPEDRIDIALALRANGLDHRTARLVGHGAAARRVDRLGAFLAFLGEAGFSTAQRVRIAGDPPQPIAERYERATDVLIALHRLELPDTLPVAPHVAYTMPPYDLDAFLIEAELLLDWYLPYRGAAATAQARALFLSLWRDALRPVLDAPKTWVLRDFHSPNLLWLEARGGLTQVGLLDFQDAVIGPSAYDLASLLQDARVDVPEELEVALFGRYVRARRDADKNFDADGFARLYATLAAQRATKILGIFARLDQRDGKPQYLQHLPRVFACLRRALTHPALGSLNDWYLANVPPPP